MLSLPSLSSLAVKALVIVGLVIAGFFYGQHVSNNAWRAKMLAEQQSAAEQYAKDAQKLSDAQSALDRANQKAAQQNADLQKRLAEIEKRPQYQAQCLDQDGINAANDALSNHAASHSLH